ncbi:Baseplate J-like protein [compost metagenome]
MYEDQTFDAIMTRMLARVPDDIDKREGSIIYDALAPAAAELSQIYIELDLNANLTFADTASGDYLDKAVAWSGVSRKPATQAVMLGVFRDSAGGLLDIPLGSRFSLGDQNYTVIAKVSTGNYRLQAETAGAAGGQSFGTLLPITYINGLASASITGLITPGTDAETDEALYERYQEQVTKPITSGNRYQYEQWAREISGVGRAKAFPLWNGAGTVKVVLLDEDMTPPEPAVVAAVQAYIDPTQDGMGEGVAPIGAVVTVVGATELPINISVDVTLASGATTEQVQEQIEEGLKDYLADLAFTDTIIRYTRIQGIILGIPPVIDYANLLVNGGAANIETAEDAVPVVGTVNVS